MDYHQWYSNPRTPQITVGGSSRNYNRNAGTVNDWDSKEKAGLHNVSFGEGYMTLNVIRHYSSSSTRDDASYSANWYPTLRLSTGTRK